MLERTKYGIEYNPRQREQEPSGLGWLLALVAVVALVSLIVTLVGRYRASRAEAAMLAEAVPDAALAEKPARTPQPEAKSPQPETPPPEPPVSAQNLFKRPQKVRNLLMRLEEAEKRRDVDMAVTTIEALRALPGSPAADIDDALARRLGKLNTRRLFRDRNPLWVKEVTVKRGDSASRIAAENGSTIAALRCLNGGSVDKVVAGQKLYVMNHPRFNLVIHRRSRTADLLLNGKFFQRYDLQAEVTGRDGVYEIPSGMKSFWKALGVSFKISDRTEIETLLPVGAPVMVSEM